GGAGDPHRRAPRASHAAERRAARVVEDAREPDARGDRARLHHVGSPKRERQQIARRRGARHRPVDALPEPLALRARSVTALPTHPPSRLRQRTPLDADAVTLSVLVPVYNERDTIDLILDQVNATPMRKEIICVNDRSTDGTDQILDRMLAQGRIDRLIHQPE